MNAIIQFPKGKAKSNSKAVLEAALEAAARREYVFPVPPGTRKSYKSQEFSDGQNWGATIDPKEIELDFRKWPDAGLGIATGPKSGIFVVDADTVEGHSVDGIASLRKLEKKHGKLPKTRTVESPSGSLHYYFKYPADGTVISNSVGDLAPGVDVRGDGGMVLAPPSVVPGKGVYRLVKDRPVADAPQWLIDRCKKETVERNAFTNASLAPPASREEVEAALAVISSDPYDPWYRFPAALDKNFGPEIGLQIFLWWSKKSAKFDERECRKKYDECTVGKSAVTDINIGTIFFHANQADPGWRAAIDLKAAQAISATPFKWIDPAKIPPRSWLYRPHYIRKFLSATISTGGVGKSSLVITEAVAMSAGRQLLGIEPEQQLRVWYWNGEDPADELQRRFAAAMVHHGVMREDIGDRLFVDSGRTMPIVIAEDTKTGTRIAEPVIEQVVATLIENRIDVLIIDPFVSSHRVAENDNSAIERVAKKFSHIAEEANCSVMIVHHSRKTNGNEMTVDDGRGASAFMAAVRTARTLNNMKKDEADNLAIPEANRRRYFRCDIGKANLTAPAEKADWFRIETVYLGNGDEVGVVTQWDVPEGSHRHLDAENIRKIQAAIKAGGPWRADQQSRVQTWAGEPLLLALGLDIALKGDVKWADKALGALIRDKYLKSVPGRDQNRKARHYVEAGKAPSEGVEVRF